MRSKTLLFFLTLLLLATLLSACTGATGIATSWPGLTAQDGTAYLAYGQFVYAVNTGNGSEVWRFPREVGKGVEFYATPALTVNDQVIVASFDHKLYSINAANGQQTWVFDKATDRYIAGPLVTETNIYAPNSDGNLYNLDLDGKLVWTFKTAGAIWGTPIANPQCDCIYVASMDRHVYAVDATSGQQVWQSPELSGSIIGSPTFDPDNKSIYVGTIGQEMVALNAENGQVRWTAPCNDWVWSGPLLAEGALYFGDEQGNFYALDASDGRQVWKIQPLPDSPIVSKPTLEAGVVYYTTESETVYGINPDGSIASTFNVAARLFTSPVWVDGKLLVAEMEGEAFLTALNENGAPQWLYVPAK